MRQIQPLLELIRSKESRNDYNAIVWLVAKHRYPPRPVSTMTVGEVLDWQDSIDRFQNSEAVGAYQIMEDTLRGMVQRGVVKRSDFFDYKTQDRLAEYLLNGRGLRAFMAGEITAEKFANSIAREWASFPVVTEQWNGRRTVKPGQSYYAGDGINKAGVSPKTVLSVLDIIRQPAPPPTPHGWLYRFAMAALKLIKRLWGK